MMRTFTSIAPAILFLGAPAAEAQTRQQPGQLSNQDLHRLNVEGRTIEQRLRATNYRLRQIDGLLQQLANGQSLLVHANSPGSFVVGVLAEEFVVRPTHLAVASNARVMESIRRMHPNYNLWEQTVLFRRMTEESNRLKQRLLAERADLQKRRTADIDRLDRIRRMVMADADRPTIGTVPVHPATEDFYAPPANIRGRVVSSVRTQVRDCWHAAPWETGRPAAPCIWGESFYTNYNLDNGSWVMDRRAYDAMRARMRAAGHRYGSSLETGQSTGGRQ